VRAHHGQLGTFPRGERPDANRAAVTEIDTRIARLEGRDAVTYLDIGASLLSPDGSISKEVIYDFPHPTAKGYDIWAEAMGPTLEELPEPTSRRRARRRPRARASGRGTRRARGSSRTDPAAS